jgi:hypothetical protein
MMADPARVAALLWSLAGPRGPMRPADEEERQRAELLQGNPVDAASALLHALRTSSPPPGVDIADAEGAAADLLSDLAADPAVVDLLIDALGASQTRAAALDALGLSGERAAEGPLAALIESRGYEGWTEREIVKLVSAVGMVAGPEARTALDTLAGRGPWPDVVEREIEIARSGQA